MALKSNSVSVSAGSFRSAGNRVRDALTRVLLFLGVDSVSLEVNLVTDAAMRTVNRDYHHADRATNVLSFPAEPSFPVPEARGRFLGEIFLAPRFIGKQGDDIVFLAVHGLLHLLGYTHNRKSDTMKMQRVERSVFKHLPYVPPHHRT